MPLEPIDEAFLREAIAHLETPDHITRWTEALAGPVGQAARLVLPDTFPETMAKVTDLALARAMNWVANTVFPTQGKEESLHGAFTRSEWTGFISDLVVAVGGAVSGVLGWGAFAVELPITTCIILRSIAETATTFGENLQDPAVRLECLSVLGYGTSVSGTVAGTNTNYFSSRIRLENLIAGSSNFLAQNKGRAAEALAEAIAANDPPALVTFVNEIAARFGLVVTQKALVRSIPPLSIALSAACNEEFARHFNLIARYHFAIRKLERKYGQEMIQNAYNENLKR